MTPRELAVHIIRFLESNPTQPVECLELLLTSALNKAKKPLIESLEHQEKTIEGEFIAIPAASWNRLIKDRDNLNCSLKILLGFILFSLLALMWVIWKDQ